MFYGCNDSNQQASTTASEKASGNSSELDDFRVPDSIKSTFETHLNFYLTKYFFVSKNESIRKEIIEMDYNNDGIQDKIITINRLDKAKNDMKNASNPAKFLDMGMIGNYNHFLLFNGKTNTFTDWKTIPSSPFRQLRIEPISISLQEKNHFLIEYRIRDAAYVNFYAVNDESFELIFQYKRFDRLSEKNPEAYVLTIEDGSQQGIMKDLTIHSAKILHIPENADLNIFDPSITKTSENKIHFFYLNEKKKYYTLKKPT